MIKKLFPLALLVTASLASRAADCPDQSDFPWIVCQPVNQLVKIGSNATFIVQADNGPLAYQWLSNGIALPDQTNDSLTISNAQIKDVALYSCNLYKDIEVVPTRGATLYVYTNTVDANGVDPIMVYGLPVSGGGGVAGNCPGAYAGYVNFTKTISNGWGWAPDTNTTTVFTAADGSGRTDTSVLYQGKSGDPGCGLTTVTIPNPPVSAKYRFTIYFPTNVPPPTNYPLVLDGFLP